MKPWLPALAGLLAAVVLATAAGVVLGGLTPGPGGTTPIALKSMSPGTQDAAHLRLTQPALPIECKPAAWIHVTLVGRCPISQSAAEAAARAALPVYQVNVPIGAAFARDAIKGAAPAAASAAPQVREAVLAWADLPAGALGNSPAQALHALVWVVAVDEPANIAITCPPIVRASSVPPIAQSGPTALVIRCGGTSRYLVFVDALSGKARLVTSRP